MNPRPARHVSGSAANQLDATGGLRLELCGPLNAHAGAAVEVEFDNPFSQASYAGREPGP